jgi:5-methylcytosine-specific restriction endonuclease McrA
VGVYLLPGAVKKPKRRRGTAAPLHFEQGFPTHHSRLYGTVQWKKLRDQFIARFGSVCQDAQHDMRYPREGKVELDHIVEVSDDPSRAFDPDNLVLRCRKCHRAKTVRVAKDRLQQDALDRLIRHQQRVGGDQPLPKPQRPAHLLQKKMGVSDPGSDET